MDARAIPAAAGTIVVGIVPKIPPIAPPYFSINSVTAIATKPANKAAIIVLIIVKSRPIPYVSL